jgi:glycosyltransferase involved in cell wall biosynthesis
MTLLFLEQFSDLGGAQFCLLDLLRHFRRLGWSLHVALPTGGPLAARVEQAGATTHLMKLQPYNCGRKTPVDLFRLLFDTQAVAGLVRELEQQVRPDLFYVNGPRLMPGLARAGLTTPVLFHSHNVLSVANGRPLVAHAIRRTGATVIAASEFAARQWISATTVYGGVAGPSSGMTDRARGLYRVGLIGRIERQKRQREFVSAALMVSDELPGSVFSVCGDVRERDRAAEQYRSQLVHASRGVVRFIGWREPVYDVLRNLDLLVMPSSNEGGFPRVLLEAFASGVPVLAAASGAVPELLQDGRNGFLLSSAEPREMARRIVEVLSNPHRMATAAYEARRLWRERFTADHFAARVTAVISGLQPMASTEAEGRGSRSASAAS